MEKKKYLVRLVNEKASLVATKEIEATGISEAFQTFVSLAGYREGETIVIWEEETALSL
jgi:hypothetical protein